MTMIYSWPIGFSHTVGFVFGGASNQRAPGNADADAPATEAQLRSSRPRSLMTQASLHPLAAAASSHLHTSPDVLCLTAPFLYKAATTFMFQ